MDFFSLDFFGADGLITGWEFWPFSRGYGEKWLPVLARIGFMFVILGGIALFLRLLFGPKGWFRDHELDREAEEMVKEELAELEREYDAGDLPEHVYQSKKKRLLK